MDDYIKPGDIVQLTGETWHEIGMHGQTAVVVDIDLDGDPLIEDPVGGVLAIYRSENDPYVDYSAERVEVTD